MRNLKFQYWGGFCLLRPFEYALRTKFKCVKMENLSGVVLLYKISENSLESKLFKTSRELPYF